MAQKIQKIFSTIRNNWKKSTVAAGLVAYGVNYGIEQIECNKMMTGYCQSALRYGEEPIGMNAPLRKIIVILNPAADKRKAKKYFENYCAPILHLSGAIIDIRVTKGEGDARKLMEGLKESVDAIIIAGGDGTVSEVVTGLLRGFNHDCSLARRVPIGIIPLGQNNNVAKHLYNIKNEDDGLKEKVQSLANASMTIVKQAKSTEMNVLCVQVIDNESDVESGSNSNKFYALNSIDWGNIKKSELLKEKYWYYGPLKKYATYIYNGLSVEPVKAELSYSNPCSGCKKCFNTRSDIKKIETRNKWHQMFGPKNADTKSVNYNMVENPQCGVKNTQSISTMDLKISAIPPPYMNVIKGQENYDFSEFVKQGWNYEETKEYITSEKVVAQEIDIIPTVESEELELKKSLKHLYIDNEEFDIRPLRITLLNNTIQVYST